jgi:23S rRNA-/tRNA-specific pseudouridylate synthase
MLNEEMKILVEKLDNKQALHANLLGFEHPLTKETLEFKSEPTEEMLKIINLI